MKTRSSAGFVYDLLLNTAAATIGAIIAAIVVIVADLRYAGDKSAVLVALLIGIPLGAAMIPAIRSAGSVLRRFSFFLFASMLAAASVAGIIATMDLYGSWCALAAPLAAGACSCLASRMILNT